MLGISSAAYGRDEGFHQVESCEDYLLLPFAKEQKRPAMTEADRQAVALIFAEPNLSTEERLSRVYKVYLGARLRQLPRELRAPMHIYLGWLQVNFSSEGEFQANAQQIELSSIFKDTALPLILMAHEHEHRIQLYLTNRSELIQTAVLADHYFLGYWAYHAEVRAMQAEWEILSILPRELRNDVLEKLEQLSRETSIPIYSSLISIVRGANQNRDEYVADQHRQGRYSRSYLISEAFKNWFLISGCGLAIQYCIQTLM